MNISKEVKLANTHRQAAIIVGILFIFATVTAILGLLFYQPILSGPDYLINGATQKNQVIVGALMELILVCTAIGTAIGLYPVLRPYGERIASATFSSDSLKPLPLRLVSSLSCRS